MIRRDFLARGVQFVAWRALRSSPTRTPFARFAQPLAIPPILRPTRTTADTDFYEIVQRPATVELLPGLPTTIWGYEGQFPGPTIHARRGRTTVVRHTNRLQTPTVVHLHGAITAPESDGFPTDLVAPGDTKTYVYPNDQRAATLWYHDHAIDHTGRNIFMGLAGLYLLDDAESANLPLPRDAYDVPLIIQDRFIGSDGAFLYRPDFVDGPDTNTVLVNGTPWPHFEVAARKYRFRILNASNATALRLALQPPVPCLQIATDGGLLATAERVSTIPLAMAERVEVVIDFAAAPVGSQIFLTDTRGPLMRFDIVRHARDDSGIPDRLSDLSPLARDSVVRTRSVLFTRGSSETDDVRWAINLEEFNADMPLIAVKAGEVEIWRLMNHTFHERHDVIHPVHLHATPFQILERNQGPPLPHERGWKDTVALAPGDEVKIIAAFGHQRGRYLMHCHNLEHEDRGMMARYDIV